MTDTNTLFGSEVLARLVADRRVKQLANGQIVICKAGRGAKELRPGSWWDVDDAEMQPYAVQGLKRLQRWMAGR